MKITTTTGHYSIVLAGTVMPEKEDELITLGVVQGLLYRGVFAPLREKTGAKRKLEDSKPFDAAVATAVAKAIETALKDYITLDDDGVVVSAYEGGEAAKPSKVDVEKWTAMQSLPEPQFAKIRAAYGIADDYDDASGIAAVRAKRLKSIADALAKDKAEFDAAMKG